MTLKGNIIGTTPSGYNSLGVFRFQNSFVPHMGWFYLALGIGHSDAWELGIAFGFSYYSSYSSYKLDFVEIFSGVGFGLTQSL